MLRPATLIVPVLLTALATAAMAQTDAAQTPPTEAAPAQAAPPLSEIILSFEERGYRLTDIDVDTDVIEVEGLDPNGARIEARVDPATGEVLSETPDD